MLVVLFVIVLSLSPSLLAEVPRLINYQGILTDSGGLPINGTPDLTVRIYADSTAGATALWTEPHTGVQVDDGLFNVILGSVTTIPDSLFEEAERWLGITVGVDPEMTPRMRITSVPWALRADVAEYSLSGGTGDSHSLDADDGAPEDVVYVDGEGNISMSGDVAVSGGVIVGSGYTGGPPVMTAPVTNPRPAGNKGKQGKDPSIPATLGASSENDDTDGMYRPTVRKPVQHSDDLRYVGPASAPPANGMIIEGDVGIGTDTPAAKLDVAGLVQTTAFKLPTGASDNLVLTSDSLGSASWQPTDTHRRILLSRWVTDWSADNAAALTSAIAAVQTVDDGWSIVGARHSGGDVVILDVPDDKVLKLESKVTVPDSLSVKLLAEGPRGMRIEYTGAGNYAIYVESGNRQVQFENIVFWKGGVELEGGVKGVRFRDCHFDGIGDFAIKTLGESVIDVAIRDCVFHDCAGGVSVGFVHSDLWIISRCAFWRNSDCDVVIGSTGILVEYCDFEIRTQGNLDKPFIHVNYGGSYVSRCRFGNEVDAWGEPPTNIVVVGPLTGATSQTITDIEIVGCKFFGRLDTHGGPSSTSAKHAILFNRQPNVSRIAGNRFNEHYGDGTDGTPCCDSAYLGTNVFVNYWTDNRPYSWGSIPPTADEWGVVEDHWLIF
jgi:hypothetical protein